MLARHLKGANSAIYYVTGPPGMIRGVRALLKTSGVDADDIRTEEFTGY
jgi:ferredoxin-NADP reductase